MPFPESERVIYKNNPLEQVVCQLRFPAILRIGTDIPVGFQERIRQSYPIFQEKSEIPLVLPPELAQQVPQEVLNSLKLSNKAYDFKSSDNDWIVSLTNNFLALTCNDYKQWEEFLNHLLIPFEALKQEYTPAFFTRVGLRYQNVIRKPSLGLETAAWSELLNEYIVGELASPELSEVIEEFAHIILVKLEDKLGHVRIRHGFAEDNKTGELVGYIIDSDFYTEEKMEVDDAIDLLVEFNRQNRQLFRWIISDQLHLAMEPQRTE